MSSDADRTPTDRVEPVAVQRGFDEEPVEDRYAALQAWTEWTRNHERASGAELSPNGSVSAAEVADRDESAREGSSADPDPPTDALPASVRAETSHDHAPYSQLFTRLHKPGRAEEGLQITDCGLQIRDVRSR